MPNGGAPPDNREADGRFRPGVSGNPGGRPKGLVALEAQIRDQHGPHVLAVLEKVKDEALAGDMHAAQLFLARVLGPPRVAPESLPIAEKTSQPQYSGAIAAPAEVSASTLADRILQLVHRQVTALEEKAAAEGLTPEESKMLDDHLRATLSIGKWDAGLAERLAERVQGLSDEHLHAEGEKAACGTLGITVEQLRAIRGERAAD